MRTKRNSIIHIAVCAMLLLLSTGIIQQIPIVSPTTLEDSIVAYGSEAETFASMLSTETGMNINTRASQPSLIVLSDINSANLQIISNSMKNGATLVAINLPEDNDIVDVPKIQEDVTVKESTVEQYSSNRSAQRSESKIVSQTSREIVPPFWIAIVKQTTPERTENYVTLNDDAKSRDDVIQLALEAVHSEAPITPSRGTGNWSPVDQKYYIVTYGTNNLNTFVYWHDIYQLDVWDSAINKEYWMVYTKIDSPINTYTSDTWHCGPYTTSKETYISANAAIYDYGPITTAESITAGIDISLSIAAGPGTGGVGASVSYSKSWTEPGVRYDVSRGGTSTQWINWIEGFRAADFTWWPWYDEPCSAAHGAHQTDRMVVYQRPVGAGISLELKDTFVIEDDYMYLMPPFGVGVIDHNQYRYTPAPHSVSYASMF